MAVRFSLLHTFVVVARCGRMRDAADVMALTPGAISQRIRELEDAIGYRLFTRTQAGVALNAAGEALFASLDAPFRMIEDVDRNLTSASAQRVTISTTGSFAASWLVPRLFEFSRRHADIDIVVETENRIVDLRREPIDLAIRHGLGNYPGLEAIWLMAPELIVVASPELLRTGRPVMTPADCLAFPLLHDVDRTDWRLWFEAHGIVAPRVLKGPAFSDDHLKIEAAASGQGLALVRDVHAEDGLRAKRLAQPIAARWPTRFAYYAVAASEASQRPAVRRFRDWLVKEASETPP
ncbi:MAG: LysR family transcriptional regulator [Methylocystaceae bacterium]|nr:MAG: LysR family transcriptional regulator [Methylocystaceae bacterium]